ncbi:MAG: hypothetical protein ACXITV_04135 [Luteibaculaceae bacterium]
MSFKKSVLGFMACLVAIAVSAQNKADSLGFRQSTTYFNQEIPIKADKELTFYAFYFNQMVTSNFYPTNDFFQGQVIGRMFGRSTAKTSDTKVAHFVEQRLIPFFVYTPKLMDGKVTLRAAFEIDWTWGDAAYGAAGNQGAAINADMVNIQTQNVQVEYIPKRGHALNFGLMRMFDTPYHPYRTTVDRMTLTGYRLFYFAADAAGMNYRIDNPTNSVTFGIYNLWENRIEDPDDVYFAKVIAQKKVNHEWKVGGSVFYVNDRSSGRGGVSILGQGLKSLLTEYTGAFRFIFPGNDFKANILWTGGFFSKNEEFSFGNHRLTGFAKYNYGFVDTPQERVATISGLGANLRYGYRYGATDDDEIAFDYIFTSGDRNGLADGVYNGVITANTWGAPGNLPISIGTNILFPSANVVNRYMPLISDISNMGFGLNAVNLIFRKSFRPHKWIGSANLAFASSNAAPQGGGFFMGTEANLGIIYRVKTLMDLEFRAAHVWLGDFYDAPFANGDVFVDAADRLNRRPTNPWTVFIAFRWLML